MDEVVSPFLRHAVIDAGKTTLLILDGIPAQLLLCGTLVVDMDLFA